MRASRWKVKRGREGRGGEEVLEEEEGKAAKV
jgi:hypothetical protein